MKPITVLASTIRLANDTHSVVVTFNHEPEDGMPIALSATPILATEPHTPPPYVSELRPDVMAGFSVTIGHNSPDLSLWVRDMLWPAEKPITAEVWCPLPSVSSAIHCRIEQLGDLGWSAYDSIERPDHPKRWHYLLGTASPRPEDDLIIRHEIVDLHHIPDADLTVVHIPNPK